VASASTGAPVPMKPDSPWLVALAATETEVPSLAVGASGLGVRPAAAGATPTVRLAASATVKVASPSSQRLPVSPTAISDVPFPGWCHVA